MDSVKYYKLNDVESSFSVESCQKIEICVLKKDQDTALIIDLNKGIKLDKEAKIILGSQIFQDQVNSLAFLYSNRIAKLSIASFIQMNKQIIPMAMFEDLNEAKQWSTNFI